MSGLRKYTLLFTIVSVIFFPSLVMMLSNGSSMAVGLFMTLPPIIILTFLLITYRPHYYSTSMVFVLEIVVIGGLILIHFVVTGYIFSLSQDNSRFFGSLAGIMVLLFAAKAVAISFAQLSSLTINRLVICITIIFFINGVISLSGIDYFGGATSKPTFLFSEPSHFSLAASPFFIFYVRARLRGWIFGLIFFFLWAIYIENVTMLMVLLLALACSLRLKIILFLAPVIGITFVSFADINYFLSRFVFSLEQANLTGLVFMQGWENAVLTVLDTNGLGVGLQQFGIASSTGEITSKVNQLFAGDLNLLDGGTTATKLIGEFGVLGVFLVFFCVFRAGKAFILIRQHKVFSALQLLGHCVSIGFIVELLMRGVGYFSPGVFIYITLYFCKNNQIPRTV